MTEILRTIAVHWFESAVLTFLAGIGGIVWKIYKKYDANQQGTMALLEDRLQQAHTYYIGQKCIYIHQKKVVMNLYYNYKNLGGNGIMDRMMADIDSIPVESYTNKNTGNTTDFKERNSG